MPRATAYPHEYELVERRARELADQRLTALDTADVAEVESEVMAAKEGRPSADSSLLWANIGNGSASASHLKLAPRPASPLSGWSQPVTSDAATIESLCATLELWRPHRCQWQRVKRLQHQLLTGLNSQAQRRLQVGDYMASTRLLRVAEGLIAAASSESQSPQPCDELKAAAFELCAQCNCAASQRIPNEGADRAAMARLKRAVQYDMRVMVLSHHDVDRLARTHARLATSFARMHGQKESSIQHINALAQLFTSGSVRHDTMSTIEADLRAEASRLKSSNVATTADFLSFAAQVAAARPRRQRAATNVNTRLNSTTTTTVATDAGALRSVQSRAVAKSRSTNSRPAKTTVPAHAHGNTISEKNHMPSWDSRLVIHTRIGEAPPLLPKPMYTLAAEKKAAKIGWRVGDKVLARHRSGEWVQATINAKRHKPGGGWYVLSQEGRFITFEICLRRSKGRKNDNDANNAWTERYRHHIQDGRQFLGDVEDFIALNAAFQPTRILLPSEQQAAMHTAMAQLDDEHATAKLNAANASRRLRSDATAAAVDCVSRILTSTFDAVEERRSVEQEKFVELDQDQSGELTKQEMKRELLRRGIGCVHFDWVSSSVYSSF